MAVNHLSYHAAVDADLLETLAAPGGEAPLRMDGDSLATPDGRRYPIQHGIPRLLAGGLRPWQIFYDRVAWAYDAILQLGERSGLGSEGRIRAHWLPELAQAGELVLDIGCGSGASRPLLPPGIRYLGIDLSFNMLRRAQRKCEALGLPAHWAQGDIGALPVHSGRAGALIAMGVLQHAASPHAALAELARVAKPGAQVLLIDEARSLRRLGKLLNLAKPASVNALAKWLGAQAEMDAQEQLNMGEYFCLRLLRRR